MILNVFPGVDRGLVSTAKLWIPAVSRMACVITYETDSLYCLIYSF